MSKILLDEMPKTPKDCPFYISGCDGMHRCRLLDDCSRHFDHVPCNFITALSETYTTSFATGLTLKDSDTVDTSNYTISAVYDPHKSVAKSPITVGELVELLNDFPQDMPVGINFQPYDEIEIGIMTWSDNNYPYERPDFDFVNIQ